MPKCAGSSMRMVFRSIYKDRLFEDDDSFFRVPREERFKAISCSFVGGGGYPGGCDLVFGHFFPIKYIARISSECRQDFALVTFLRDPLQRLASHYAYWTSVDASDHYLWRKMIREDWSFSRFALSIEMRNFYSQYLFQVPLDAFDFIGIHENLGRDWPRLCRFLSIEQVGLPSVQKSNSAAIISGLSQQLKREICDCHSEDYFIYEQALERPLSGCP